MSSQLILATYCRSSLKTDNEAMLRAFMKEEENATVPEVVQKVFTTFMCYNASINDTFLVIPLRNIQCSLSMCFIPCNLVLTLFLFSQKLKRYII